MTVKRPLIIYLLLPGLLPLAACSPEPPATDKEMSVPALITAAEQGDISRVQNLLSAHDPVDGRDSCQWTPLMKAALYGHIQVADQLIKAGARVDLVDNGGYTALMLAASNNHAGLVKALLAWGANPNLQESTKGWTALIWAAKRGHLESVSALISGGATVGTIDFAGETARSWADKNHHPQVIRLLDSS
ncbi:ankyrin repeat domain-containing protein [Sedimenticola selenatireducens]|uniref:ankyrin repeat domain-containing protein n=1 Tax=Sedimenticola selenatireducens TaxID=191960 RepID=UPI002AAB2CE2|nr:ankyrin repeat domain-containing protein [Sedimenticola selenatireducens]